MKTMDATFKQELKDIYATPTTLSMKIAFILFYFLETTIFSIFINYLSHQSQSFPSSMVTRLIGLLSTIQIFKS